MSIKILKTSKKSQARKGRLQLNHGTVETPFFMPIATYGAVKNVSTQEVKELGAEIILSNTYHLYLKPGPDLIKKMGGLHEYMQWDANILTDSGGYQVFSLGGNKGTKEKLTKITEEGVEFRSHYNGSKHFFHPETSIEIQQKLGVDIMMAFDVCPPSMASHKEILRALELTTAWGKKCIQQQKKGKYGKKGQILFGIVQGGISLDLRAMSAAQLTSLDFGGFAVGGLAVGEAREDMYRVLDVVVDLLPKDKPRYLMGVGKPEEIVYAVKKGIDMFDCVIPTREARHGRLYRWCKKKKGAIHLFGSVYYETINISKSTFAMSKASIYPNSKLQLLRKHSLGYLHHLIRLNEGLGLRLASLNNIEFYLSLMEKIRKEIASGKL